MKYQAAINANEEMLQLRKANSDYDAIWAKQLLISSIWNDIENRHASLFSKENIGSEVGPGWWEALESAFVEIETLMSQYPSLVFSVVQIKEKFGTLRFYYDLSHKEESDEEISAGVYHQLDAIIMKLETSTSKLCEVCGKPGHQGGKSWIRTLCDYHHSAL